MSNEAASPSQATRSGSSADEQEPDRPERMRDWLIRMINSGRFPGLEWMDPEKTVFKVPWIHAKKRGYNRDRDAALFKEWAIHSGKYRDESDPTVWKINFRCAINGLKDILELKDYQTEDCRVYKVLPRTRPPKRRRRSLRSTGAEPYPTYPVVTAAASTLMSATSIPSVVWPSPLATEPYSTAAHYQQGATIRGPSYSAIQPIPTCHCPPSSSTSPAVTMTSNEIGTYYCTNPYSSTGYPASHGVVAQASITTPVVSGDCSYPTAPVTNNTTLAIRREESPDSGYGGGIIVEPSLGSPVGSPSHPQPSPEVQQQLYSSGSPTCGVPSVSSVVDPISSSATPPISGSVITTAPTTDDEFISIILDQNSPLPQSPPLTPPTPPSNQIVVTVYYGNMPVLSKNVSCTKGCRLFYGPNYQPPANDEQAARFESYFGPLEAEQLSLPHNHPVPQAKCILDSMSRGLLIEMHDNDVFVTPLCKSIVFYGSSYYHQSTALERETRMKVFDYNVQFRQLLEQFSMRRTLSPSPHIILSLGQSWGPQQPITNNYIYVVITHVQAERDLKMYGSPQPTYPYSADLFGTVPDIVDVRQASATDIRAESFLNSVFQC